MQTGINTLRMQPPLVVTRPQPEAALWVQQLNAEGVEAIALPMMEIGASQSPAAVAAVHKALQQLQSYRALMFVSGNAVRYFFDQLRQHKLSIDHTQQCWSPGPGTSKALLSEGIKASALIQPAPDAPQFDSESLWEQAQHHIQAGDRVLIVRGGDGTQTSGQGRQWLTQQLQLRGVEVDFAPIYERHAPMASAQLQQSIESLRARHAAWLFSSSECIQNLMHCAPTLQWAGHTALATHPRIAQQARHTGFGHVVETLPTVQAIAGSIKSLHDLT